MILKDKRYFVLFLVPALLIITVVIFYPLMRNFYYSFFSWDGFTPKPAWIGLSNYEQLLNDFVIPKAIVNTLELFVITLIFEVGVALVLALLVDSIKAGYKFFRTVYFFPVIISGAAIGLMFFLMYSYDTGSLNALMTMLGLPKQVWLNERSAMPLVSIPVVWQYTGFYFIIFLTAFSKIPEEIYESAEIDGISGAKRAIFITIPLIKSVILTNITLIIAGVFKAFDVVFMITDGKPLYASELLTTYMNRKSFADMNWGYGSTISILIFVIAMLLWFVTTKAIKDEKITY